MSPIPVHFEYLTGFRRNSLIAARLGGTWDGEGRQSDQWSWLAMQPFTAEDGCPAFRATMQLDDSQIGQNFRWGVSVGTPDRPEVWGIASELDDVASSERNRTFTLRAANQTERYYLTHCRRLGANKLIVDGQTAIRFAVWAPNARNVELVRGRVEGELSEGRPGVYIDDRLRGGYIGNDGSGVSATIPMHRGEDGIWSTEMADAPDFANFAAFDHTPYMFRITKDDGSIAYRTDIYSRCQIGSGGTDPATPNTNWSGLCRDLDGAKSCSVVVDPERVQEPFEGDVIWPETRRIAADDFWRNEFDPNLPLPCRIEDIVIYELHVDDFTTDGSGIGTLRDALNLIPYMRDLGANCVQLTSTSEFQDRSGGRYTTSHFFAIQCGAGGRDQLKYFVRECHRNGIAVILDVVYNHYTFNAERAEWAYDSNAPENNIYYWYEGRAADYPNANGSGGYLDNGSGGWAPRYWEEMVRKMFTSSAAALVSEFHVDGFRVKRTQAIHRDNVRHADGIPVGRANIFGQRFLREWSNTLKLINVNVLLMAQDESTWPALTQRTDSDGVGFDVVMHSRLPNQPISNSSTSAAPGDAVLIDHVDQHGNEPLHMNRFAEMISATRQERVVIIESQDTARAMLQASSGGGLTSENRLTAEASSRVSCGLLLLARGTPMFLMGAEVGSTRGYAGLHSARDHLQRRREGPGRMLFRFYSDMIRLRLSTKAFRSSDIEMLYVNNVDRVLAFRRCTESDDFLIIASLNNAPFTPGYRIHHDRLPDGQWREVVNSDANVYGGRSLSGEVIVKTCGGTLTAVIPPCALVVLQRI